MKRLILIPVILALSLTCFAQKGKWEKAQKINTIESYQEFLIKYPETEYSDDAKSKLIELEFAKAIKNNTTDGYKYFLKEYRDNKYTKQVIENLFGLEFEDAKKLNTILSYEQFLKIHPNSKYELEAKQYLQEKYYENAVRGNTNDLYNDFLERYPNNKYEDDIKGRMVKLLYKYYTTADISIGSNIYENVKIKNLIFVRVSNQKNKSEQGIPIMNSEGSFLIENGEIKIDKKKKAYSITYYAINGQDISDIRQNKISIQNNRKIYRFEIINDNPKIDDSFLLSTAISSLENNALPRGTAIAVGFCWFGQLSNGDFAFEARNNFKNTSGIANVGLLNISVYEDKEITGNIIGQVLLDNGKYIISPSIECLTNNNDGVKISLTNK